MFLRLTSQLNTRSNKQAAAAAAVGEMLPRVRVDTATQARAADLFSLSAVSGRSRHFAEIMSGGIFTVTAIVKQLPGRFNTR